LSGNNVQWISPRLVTIVAVGSCGADGGVAWLAVDDVAGFCVVLLPAA
jgi:hypothetical protein